MTKRTNQAVWSPEREYWYIAVQKNGVRKFFYSSTPGRKGKAEAHAKADQWLEGTVQNTSVRCAAAVEQYLESRTGVVATGHLRAQQSRFQNHILPVIGRFKVSDLTEAHLQSVIDTAFKKHKLSAKTLRNIRADLSSFLKYARRNHMTTLRTDDLEIPARAARSEKTILQPSDLQVLFTSDVTTHYTKPVPDNFIHAYRFAVLTGLRPGELLGLRWCDVHGNTVRICRSINAEGEVTQGKNANAIRTVVLSDLALQELNDQRAITGKQTSVFGIESQSYFLKRWHRYCTHNNITQTSLYELRHTFVSIAQSLPEGMVKNLVGHSKSMDTWGTYAHMVDGQQQQQAALLQQTFSAAISPQNTEE